MSQILLIDFSEEEVEELKLEVYDAELKYTNWVSGKTESLIPPNDCKIIFYSVNNSNLSASVHSDDTKYFETLISAGSVMICFIGDTRSPHITNLTSIPFPSENIHYNSEPSRIESSQDSVFAPIFSRFGSYIRYCASLEYSETDLSPKIDLNEDKQIIAIHKGSKYPVAIYFKHGEGFILLLPYFADENIGVIKLFLNEILPTIRSDLFEDKENRWLHDSRYYIPSLLDLTNKRKSIREEYVLKIGEIDKKIEKIQKKEQNIFNKLLTSKKEELKETVTHWFKYIGFTVVDVDKYWKKEDPSRQMEEDLWLFQKKKPKMCEDEVILVEVKSSTGGATDDDVATVQKYKGRRMKEFRHINIKGLLVGNYFCNKSAHSRKLPFSDNQVKDAERDGNALLTTYELFEAIRMEKLGELGKTDIQVKIRETSGVIKWDKPVSQA
ncbi:MAG: hypothetical protein Q7J55_06490 [bacterium]|nr:hypothetical protein [bacterium]